MWKKRIVFALTFAVILQGFAAQLKLQVIPRTVTAGEPAELLLAVESYKAPTVAVMPEIKGLEWLGSASSIRQQLENGKLSTYAERRFSFIIEKPGEYTIPALEVRYGNQKSMTEPFTFTVSKASLRQRSEKNGKTNSGQIDIDQAVFSELTIPGEKKSYYAGEYIPLEIKVFCLSGIKLQLAYPIISSNRDNIIFRDYKDVNPQNPDFDRPSSFVEQRNGQEYICYRFRTEVKAISIGELQISSRTQTEIQVPASPSSRSTRDPFFDDFFDSGFFSRTVRHTARSESGKINILPLPPAPANVKWLGLTGNWNLDISLSSKSTEVGKAVTLLIKVRGTGSLETLQAPELDFPGFRVYSPEVTRSPDGRSAEIRYILIPTKQGELELSQTFAVFNPQTAAYEETKFHTGLTVDHATAVVPALQGANVVDTARPEPDLKEDPVHALAGIMYLKKLPDSETRSFLRGMIILFPMIGIFFLIFCEIFAAASRGSSLKAKRKASAKKQKKILLAKLKKANSEEVYQMAPELSDFLNDALDYPPGTSLDEISEKIDKTEPELSRELKGISAGAWAPGAAYFSGERKENLIRLLGKILSLILLFAIIPLSADQETAAQDYDSGKFKDALSWYLSALEQTPDSPALLYNAGNCFYQQKEYSKALLCYERAHLLAPRDPEIKRNLELSRRALDLTSSGKMDTPSDLIAAMRDQLTPEEWMLIAAIGLMLLLIVAGLRHFPARKYLSSPAALIGGLLLILGIAMVINQYQTSYAADRAIILQNGIRLRNLPSETSNYINDDSLFSGEEVTIRETRHGGWIRIKAGNAVGWIPSKSAGTLTGKDITCF